MGKYKRLATNSMWIMIGSAGSKFLALAMLPFYTKWLSVEDYGLTDILNVYVTLLMGIFYCCISDALFVIPKDNSINKQIGYFSSGLRFIFLLSVICAIVFCVLSVFADYYRMSNSLFDNLWFVYFMLIAQNLHNVFQQFSRSIDCMRVYSFAGLVVTASTAVFSLYYIPKYGVTGYIYSLIFSYLFGACYSFFAAGLYKFIDNKHVSSDLIKELLKYSVPLIPNGVMWWLVGALNRPIMESSLGLYEIGIFAVANKFPGIMAFIFSIFSRSWQISVIEEFYNKSFNSFFNKILQLTILCLCLLVVFVTIISKSLIELFSDVSFFEAWHYVPLLAFATFFNAISGFFGNIFSATRKSKYYFYSSIYGGVGAVVLNYFLIPLYGLYGACIATILSFVFIALSRIFYSRSNVQINKKPVYLIEIALVLIFIIIYVNEYNVKMIPLYLCVLLMLLFFMNLSMIKQFRGFIKIG